MARIQYQPASRSRGFKPRNLSTAGINRMREESNRIVRNMEQNRQAEKEQRDRELQAMQEDRAYEAAIEKQNFNTQLENLRTERNEIVTGIQLEDAEAKADQAKTQAILTSISSLSQIASTAASYGQKLDDANQAKEQKRISNLPGHIAPTADLKNRDTTYQDGLSQLKQGGVAQAPHIIAEGVQGGVPEHEIDKDLVSSPGRTGPYNNINLNKTYKGNFPGLEADYLADSETKLTAPNGREFVGPEALSDPYLRGVIQQRVHEDLIHHYGITDLNQIAPALKQVEAANLVKREQSAKNLIKQTTEIAIDQADTFAEEGSVESLYAGFDHVKNFKGAAGAHDWLQEQIEDPNTPQTTVDNIGNLVLGESGKRYADEWPNRWGPAMQARNEAVHKLDKAEEDLRQYEIKSKIIDNIEEIREAYNEDPAGSSAYMQDYFHSEGMTVPALVKEIERNALKRASNETAELIAERTRFGILDPEFVNSIEDPKQREDALNAYAAQEERKYGPESAGIKKGMLEEAKTLTKINSEGSGSAQTFLVHSRMVKEYNKFLQETNDPLTAYKNVQAQVTSARNGDVNSPFYFSDGAHNRRTFTNIETSDVEKAERRTYIFQKIKEIGVDTVNRPFTLAEPVEMDATYSSLQNGEIMYPPGVLQFAEQFGFKPSEVYNAQRQANNTVTGENKPLLTPSTATELVDSAPPELRNLFQSGSSLKIRRGGASMGLNGLPLRSTMGGTSYNSNAVPSGYGGIIDQAANQNNIPSSILAGLIDTESAFNPGAVSKVGARGLGQFMPATAAEFGVDVNDPVSSINGAARYLRYLIDYFNGDMEKAIYAYNGGMGNIERYGGPIPGNVENQEYLTKVLNNANKYR